MPNHEERFRAALDQIAHYDSADWLRSNCERRYGLTYVEALEMAYENIIDEAKYALGGTRKKRSKPVKVAASPSPD